MKEKKCLSVLLVCIGFMLALGCATQKPMVFESKDLNTSVNAGDLVKKVDAFLVILDASSSMNETYGGCKKEKLAQQILLGMNQTIPDLEISGALRTLGDTWCPVIEKTTLVYGPTSYSKSDFESALQDVGWPSGKTPMAKAINAASKDLEAVKGEIAVIVISDGEDMDDAPVAAAEAMKSQYGDRICIYTIVTGSGETVMERIAQAGKCGFSTPAGDLTSASEMADFVKAVFLKQAASGPTDSDGDGVYDDRDRCPGTPSGIRVDGVGCPLDSDGDGVYDHEDKCPNTPQGVSVNRRGCPLDTDNDGIYDYLDACPHTPEHAQVNEKGCWILEGLRFDTGKSTIKPRSYPILNEVVTVLKRNPALKIRIEGHTDNVGGQAYNQRLSEQRAKAVKEYLLSVGIDENRLTSKGYGYAKPIASNETAQGRAQNRRVELTPIR